MPLYRRASSNTGFERDTFLSETCWGHFISKHLDGYCIIDHPSYEPDGPHFLIYDPAIIGGSTAAYLDCTRILDTIQALHIDGQKKSFKVAFVVGDQQLYDRVCNLVIQNQERYKWVVPLNGDFHFCGHSVGAFHDLWFLPFTSWVVQKLGPGFEKVIKEKDDKITHFKHYDHFNLLLTLSIVILLHETLDDALLRDHSTLLGLAKENKGTYLGSY